MNRKKAVPTDVQAVASSAFFHEAQRQYFLLAEAIRRPGVLDNERTTLKTTAEEMLRSAGVAALSVGGLANTDLNVSDDDALAAAHVRVVTAFEEVEAGLLTVAKREHAAGRSSEALDIVDAVLQARPESISAGRLKKRVEMEVAEAERKVAEERKAEEAARKVEEARLAQERKAEEAARKVEEARLAQEAAREAALSAVREMEFVKVSAGKFTMGETGKSGTTRTVQLGAYEIGRFPVTVRQFAAFVTETGYSAAAEATSSLGARDDHPVTLVSWHDAVAFCVWASEVTGQSVRLPSEQEWEKAARGTDGRLYPWGDSEPSSMNCNFGQHFGGTTPVGKFSPRGDSPYGAADMAGNVWEWCADQMNGSANRVLRGGSWYVGTVNVRAASRIGYSPDNRISGFGFRCARSS